MNFKDKRIHICHITSVHPAFDDRIFYKEARTLVNAGYDVVLIAQHDKEEVVNDIKVVQLPSPINRIERMTKVPWILFKLALKENAYLYHFHDPELIPVGLTLKLFAKKVIYDVHELVYFQISDKNWLKFRIVKKLFQWVYLLFERLSIIFFDRLILAEDDYKNYYNRTYKNFCKYNIIRNFPILSLIKGVSSVAHLDKQKPAVIYAGGLSKIRGIKEIIQSMEFVGDKAELWLLGRWESEEFKKECQESKGWKYTKYLGFLPLSEVYKYIKVANIGMSILYPLKNYMTSLPVKAFEYMACSLPMVMSNFPFWKETFRECAVFANYYNPKDIAEKILYLLDNPNKAKELGEKGKELVETRYSWEKESHRLIDLYAKLLK